MGLLEALDFHKDLQTGRLKDYVEVEYRLQSWGDILCPFIGDREHSTAARFVLTEFPFKLFSSSTPYGPLPQRLCLTFRAPHEERVHSKDFIRGGYFPLEIANEFVAFLSLVSRRRTFVRGLTRTNGLPTDDEAEPRRGLPFQERQRMKEIHPGEIYRLLNNLQTMERRIANGFVLGMRLYHSAIEMMYTDPEFSYLLLVTSLEAVSSVEYEKYVPKSAEEFFDSQFRGWRHLSNALPAEQKPKLREVLLSGQEFTLGKLREFLVENVPQRFWSEGEDDAKPDYLVGVIGRRGEEYSRSDITIQQLERIDPEDLPRTVGEIYRARSKLIHEGIRLPSSIVIGLFRDIPADALEEITKITMQGTEIKKRLRIPPLLTFERLVSYSMVEFLSKHAGRV